jgi:hypothetical protein
MRCLTAWFAAFVVVVGGCSTPPPRTPPPSSNAAIATAGANSLPPQPTPTPTTRPLTASDDRLTVDVHLSATTVKPGGKVTVDVTIHNDGSTASNVSAGFCDGKAAVSAELPLPREPYGRTWAGFAAQYKAFVLSHVRTNDGDVAWAQGLPDRPGVTPFFCPPSSNDSGIMLEPGDQLTSSITLAAELVPGVPALPGDMPFTVQVLHDPAPMPTGPCPCARPPYRELIVSGVITITGDAPHLLSEGEVVDALLADERFSKWLTKEPQSTWDIANLGLENIGDAQGIVPAGPSWRIDLFREVGVPRHWAIGYVDPFSGEIRNLVFCNIPCSR